MEEFPRRLRPVSGSTGPNHKKKVLIVDDEPANIVLLQAMLHALGFSVVAAHGGREAFQLWTKHQDEICLVLTDMMMPDMNGAELISAIHGQSRSVNIAVVSGHSRADYGQTLTPGVTIPWLQKPFTLHQLQGTIRTLRAS